MRDLNRVYQSFFRAGNPEFDMVRMLSLLDSCENCFDFSNLIGAGLGRCAGFSESAVHVFHDGV